MAEPLDPLVMAFARSRPDDLAALVANADLRELSLLVSAMPADVAASVSARLPSWQLTGLLSALDAEAIAEMLLRAPADDAVAIVSHLSQARYAAILQACPESRRPALRRLFEFPSHSLASLAATRFIRVPAAIACGQFAVQLASSGDTRARPLLVVDERGRYVGLLTPQALFAQKNHALRADEAAVRVEPLSGMTSAESALGSRLWTRYNDLPVVDNRHRLLGVVNRAALLRIAGDDRPGEFGAQRLFSELATGYLDTCARLLEALLGRSR